MLIPLTAVLAGLFPGVPAQPPDSAQAYAIENLGTLSPNAPGDSRGTEVNDLGETCGYYQHTNVPPFFTYRPFVHAAGVMTPLVSSGSSFAYSLNLSGQVVGQHATQHHAYLWQNGQALDIHYGNMAGSLAHSINRFGHVGGVYEYAPGIPSDYRGFIRNPAGNYLTIPTLGGSFSEVNDVNDVAHACGTSLTAADKHHAFFWSQATGLLDCGTFGAGTGIAEAFALSIHDEVVGYSKSNGVTQPFLWTLQGGMVALPLPSGATLGLALDLNSHGAIVGYGSTAGGDQALLWQGSSGAVDLNALIPAGSGWTLRQATGVSDLGEITGWGEVAGQGVRGFRLTPTTGALCSGLQPAQPGVSSFLTVAGFPPAAQVKVWGGRAAGTTPIPGCPAALGIAHPVLLGTLTADAQGRGLLRIQVPRLTPGVRIYVQAADQAGCTVSNLVPQTVI